MVKIILSEGQNFLIEIWSSYMVKLTNYRVKINFSGLSEAI